jgi:hypothetical protein
VEFTHSRHPIKSFSTNYNHFFARFGLRRKLNGPFPEGLRQNGQDEGRQDDGGRGQVDELLRAAEVGHSIAVGSTLPRGGDVSRPRHRGHIQDGEEDGEDSNRVPRCPGLNFNHQFL